MASRLGKKTNIAIKELIPIVISLAIWGKHWGNQTISFYCDNMAVVKSLCKGATKDPLLSHLIRCLHFFEAYFGFSHRAYHIEGKLNHGLDVLSCNKIDMFFHCFPQARSIQATIISPSLTSLLFDPSLP